MTANSWHNVEAKHDMCLIFDPWLMRECSAWQFCIVVPGLLYSRDAITDA